jgi:hypothetical protein
MMLLVNVLETFPGDMGINLGGGNIRMSQHRLYGTQIGAVIQQMGGK